MKIAFKINLLFTGIVSCILFGMGVLVLNLSRDNIRDEFRQRIKTRAGRAAYLYDIFRYDTTNLLKSLDANSPPVLLNKNIGIYDSNFNELYEYHDPTISELRPDTAWLNDAKLKGERFIRRGEKDIIVTRYQDNLLVMVAAEDIAGRDFINNLQNIFLIYFPLALIVTLLTGYLFSRTIIRPIKQTIHDVELITSQNLSHRLYTGKGRDELAKLNATFNSLLDRLEESFAMEKRFISNASHELSTPLTAISSQIEVALLQEREKEEYTQVMSSVLKDAQDLQHLVRNLLEIAKAGSHGMIALEKLRIDEILFRAHSDVLRQNPEYKIELELPDLPEDENECMVFGNAHLLNSAFKNLIENGCKYSPDSHTHIQIEFKGVVTTIHFSNKSDVLSSEEIDKLFEPFYRGTNAGNKPGVGLGLALTRRIIGLHKGNLTIHSDPGTGTSISIELPTLGK